MRQPLPTGSRHDVRVMELMASTPLALTPSILAVPWAQTFPVAMLYSRTDPTASKTVLIAARTMYWEVSLEFSMDG